MLTKTCKNCGWEYPGNTNRMKCVICGTLFTEGPCSICGNYTDNLVKGKYCRQCYDKKYNTPATQEWRRQQMEARLLTYAEWKSKIEAIPASYPTLTEEQWLRTCKHFNGCAFCGSDSIDSRVYFIPFALGGRYCDWNILPACERCTLQTKLQPNPFIRLQNRVADDRKALNNILEYLEVLLNNAYNTSSNTNK